MAHDPQSSPSPPAPSAHPHQREHFELSEEEKAVLLECRRGALVRGVPLGFGSMLALRWFVKQGRTSLHIQRWAGAYYTLTFMGGFFFGVNSYQKTCFEKIMSLENSRLADQIRARKSGEHSGAAGDTAPDHPHTQPRPLHSRHYQPPPSPSPSSPPHKKVPWEEYKSSDSHSQSGTVSSTEEYTGDANESTEEQPDAFGGPPAHPQGFMSGAGEPMKSAQRGRNFDEIREESRRQQLQQNFPRTGGGRGEGEERREEQDWRQRRQSDQGSGASKPVRRNKYGDVIFEEKK